MINAILKTEKATWRRGAVPKLKTCNVSSNGGVFAVVNARSPLSLVYKVLRLLLVQAGCNPAQRDLLFFEVILSERGPESSFN